MASHREVSPILGRYQFLHMLGRTQGELTLQVDDPQANRQQRIVLLTADWACAPQMREALLASWTAISGIRHPNLLQVIHAGITPQDYPLAQGLPRIKRSTPFVVTELCPGRDLSSWLGTGPLHAGFVAEVCEQAGAALAAAAAQGIYHLCLQPESIYCHVDEEISDKLPKVKLLNLGLASVARGEMQHLPWLMAMRSGLVYMAPELLAADSALPPRLAACDQYALAAVTYQLMSGRPPFGLSGEADEGIKRFIQEVQSAPVLPLPSSCGAYVSAVLMRALSKRPEQRYDSIAEFSAALRDALSRPVRPQGPGRRSTLAWTFVIAGGLLTTLTVLPFVLSSSETLPPPISPDLKEPEAPRFDLRPVPPPPDLRAPIIVKPPPPPDLSVPDLYVAPPPADPRPAEPLPVPHIRPQQSGAVESIKSLDPSLRCGVGQPSGMLQSTTSGDDSEMHVQKKPLPQGLLACIGRANLLLRHFPIALFFPRPNEFKITKPLILDEWTKQAINECANDSLESLKEIEPELLGVRIELRCKPR